MLVARHEAQEPSPKRLPELLMAVLPVELGLEHPCAQHNERHVLSLGAQGGQPWRSGTLERACSHATQVRAQSGVPKRRAK